MKTPRALLICYYFPPLGGAGIGRPLALYKYLPQHGIDCDILTVKPVLYRVYEKGHLAQLDTSRIYRAGSFDPQRIMYLLGLRRMRGTMIDRSREMSSKFFPDSKIGWVRPAVRLGRQIAASNDYDMLISTSPPISCHLVARQIARETNIPWVADFRDMWTALDIDGSYADPKMRERAGELLADIRGEAKGLVSINQTIADYLGGAELIPNCFDQELASLFSPTSSGAHFVISLLGSFNELYPVDPLCRLLQQLFEMHPDLRDRVRLQQIGNVDTLWLNEHLARYDLQPLCDRYGFLPRRDAIIRASEASCFYVSAAANGAAFSTGKVLYPLASGRPILASAPRDGELATILRRVPVSHLIDPDNLRAAIEWLRRLIEQHGHAPQNFPILPEYAHEYSSTTVVSRYADFIKRLVKSS